MCTVHVKQITEPFSGKLLLSKQKMVDSLYSTAQLNLRMRFISEFVISLPSPELSHTVERNPEHPLFLCISFHQQLFLTEPTEMFLLLFPSLAHTFQAKVYSVPSSGWPRSVAPAKNIESCPKRG